jgi:hypothetical protein
VELYLHSPVRLHGAVLTLVYVGCSADVSINFSDYMHVKQGTEFPNLCYDLCYIHDPDTNRKLAFVYRLLALMAVRVYVLGCVLDMSVQLWDILHTIIVIKLRSLPDHWRKNTKIVRK